MQVIAQIINGLSIGSGLAIMGVGLTYTLGLARIFNFAYGTFFVVAAYAIIKIESAWGADFWLAAIAGLIAAAVAGVLFTALFIFPTLKRGGITVMMATLGADIALTNLLQEVFGANVQSVSSPLVGVHLLSSAQIEFSAQDLASVAAAVGITAAVSWYLHRTTSGYRLRAAAENSDLAAASGVNVRRMYLLAVTVGIAIVGVGAVFYAPLTVLTNTSGTAMLLIAFGVVAIAGVGRLWGAFAVGLAYGVFQSLFVQYVNGTLATVALYAGLIVLLAFRPRGLFGEYS